MHSLEQLEKQQVGLRLPKYLVDEIDLFTKEYALNRSEIITESIKVYLNEQRANSVYASIEKASIELKAIKDGQVDTDTLGTLDEFIDELDH